MGQIMLPYTFIIKHYQIHGLLDYFLLSKDDCLLPGLCLGLMSHNFRTNFRSWFAYRTITFKDITSLRNCLTPKLWKQNILTLFTVYLSLLTRKNYPIHIAGSHGNCALSASLQEIRQYRPCWVRSKRGWGWPGEVHSSLEIIFQDTGIFWRKVIWSLPPSPKFLYVWAVWLLYWVANYHLHYAIGRECSLS